MDTSDFGAIALSDSATCFVVAASNKAGLPSSVCEHSKPSRSGTDNDNHLQQQHIPIALIEYVLQPCIPEVGKCLENAIEQGSHLLAKCLSIGDFVLFYIDIVVLGYA